MASWGRCLWENSLSFLRPALISDAVAAAAASTILSSVFVSEKGVRSLLELATDSFVRAAPRKPVSRPSALAGQSVGSSSSLAPSRR